MGRGGAGRGEASGVARPREGVRGGSSSERSYSSPRAILSGVLGLALLAVVSDVEEGGDLQGTCTCTLCNVRKCMELHLDGTCMAREVQSVRRVDEALLACMRTERVTCEKLIQVDAVVVAVAEAVVVTAAVPEAVVEAEAVAVAVVAAAVAAAAVTPGRGSSSSVLSGGKSSHMAESR